VAACLAVGVGLLVHGPLQGSSGWWMMMLLDVEQPCSFFCAPSACAARIS
jgi:hypothetical protein